jgi:hypothetical protein
LEEINQKRLDSELKQLISFQKVINRVAKNPRHRRNFSLLVLSVDYKQRKIKSEA